MTSIPPCCPKCDDYDSDGNRTCTHSYEGCCHTTESAVQAETIRKGGEIVVRDIEKLAESATDGGWKEALSKIMGGYFTYDQIVAFISDLLRKEREAAYFEGAKAERQFILNVLDGIDEADRQMGNKGGGTKAIRFALQSRIIQSPPTSQNEGV